MKDHIPERLDKSLSSLSSDVVFNEKAANGSHKKPIKSVTLVKLALPSPPLWK